MISVTLFAMANHRVYLDYNATTPLRPSVRDFLASEGPTLTANPSSVHSEGRRIRRRIDEARETVAKFLGAEPSEVIFTSGGTESNHLAWSAFSKAGTTAWTTAIEHPSVLSAAENAKSSGAKVMYIPARSSGEIASEAFSPVAEFLSIQHANNETGVIHRIPKTPRFLHVDAAQSLGKLPVRATDLGAHYISFSGHKLGALQGCGVLVARKGAPLEPIWLGGKQERERRTGTENVVGILSIGAAIEEIQSVFDTEVARTTRLRDQFEAELLSALEDVEITGKSVARLCNTSHISFGGVDGESLLIAADLAGMDCSLGAACSSGSIQPSHVLLAMGFSVERAKSSLRFSMGWNTSEDDVSRAVEILTELVTRIRHSGEGKRRASI